MDIHQTDPNKAYRDFCLALDYCGIRLTKEAITILFDKIGHAPAAMLKEAIENLRENSKRSISASDIEAMVKRLYGRGQKHRSGGSCDKCGTDGLVVYTEKHPEYKNELYYAAACDCEHGNRISRSVPRYSQVQAGQ